MLLMHIRSRGEAFLVAMKPVAKLWAAPPAAAAGPRPPATGPSWAECVYKVPHVFTEFHMKLELSAVSLLMCTLFVICVLKELHVKGRV